MYFIFQKSAGQNPVTPAFNLYSSMTRVTSCLTMCNFPDSVDRSLAPLDAPAFSHAPAHTQRQARTCTRAHTFHQ